MKRLAPVASSNRGYSSARFAQPRRSGGETWNPRSDAAYLALAFASAFREPLMEVEHANPADVERFHEITHERWT